MNSFRSFSPESSLRSQTNLPYDQQMASISIMSFQDLETLQSFFIRNSIEQSFKEFDEKTSLFYEKHSFFQEKPRTSSISQEKMKEKFKDFSHEKPRNSKEKPRISPENYEDCVFRRSLLSPYMCKPWFFPEEDDGFNSLMKELDHIIKRAGDNVKVTEKFLQDYKK